MAGRTGGRAVAGRLGRYSGEAHAQARYTPPFSPAALRSDPHGAAAAAAARSRSSYSASSVMLSSMSVTKSES